MIIKVNKSELEISENSDVYIGISKKGQIFKKRKELNSRAIMALSNIQREAENLIRNAEKLLSEECSL